jgi:ABC-type multidrug transport system ATPase subunit
MFKSEVRQSTINELLEKAANRSYRKYLPKLTLKRLRGFSEEPVSFDFPVTAIIGPNGGGKTTVMGAAACAYKAVSPRRFFAKSGIYDESMQDWSIEYEIVDKDVTPRDVLRRTANFKNLRWNRDAPDREVLIFGVSRTVPANERSDMAFMARNKFAVPAQNITLLSESVATAVSRILGKDVRQFSTMRRDARGDISLLAGRTSSGSGYTEFHFGAGESSIIRMVLAIESAPDSCLILIEEIENGLHPVATIRLVEYLVEVADRKKVQVIFTTHSNEALLPLPSKAVWVATKDKLYQGKLDIASLRAITGEITKTAAVFVEDMFAKAWVEAILRTRAMDLVDHVEVHAMEGDGIAVAVNRHHNLDPSVEAPSVCIVDGDSKQQTSEAEKVYRLPGNLPEAFVFDQVLEKWDQIGGKLSVALWKDFNEEQAVKSLCHEVRRQNMDAHLLYTQLGEKLGLVPGPTVAGAFCTIWTQSNEGEAAAVVEIIRNATGSLKQA